MVKTPTLQSSTSPAEPKDTSSCWAWGTFGVVAVLWAVWLFLGQCVISRVAGVGQPAAGAAGQMAEIGQFGDMFGVINTLFTGLAFAAFIWTGKIQRHQLATQWWELRQVQHAAEERKKEVCIGHLEAIAVGVRIAGALADGYFKGSVPVPSYRIPLHDFTTALSELVRQRRLSIKEVEVLARYLVDAESFNLGLDYAQKERSEGRDTSMNEEVRRTRLKANHIRPDGDVPRYSDAIAVLEGHLPEDSLRRLELGDFNN